MNLKQEIIKDLGEALKARDEIMVSVLRLCSAAIKNMEIEKRTQELDEETMIQILTREARKRKEAIESYKKGGREELAKKEARELKILERYLPEQLSDDKIKAIIKEEAEKLGAGVAADFGRVMGAVMGRVKGKADGAVVQRLVKEALV